ncbi:MAG: chemotaxis response regulator protein-glutamate methylesterase [Chromatiales bacterium]|nr:chemotaxis response regulator protein-glutamate methylesterase [Gammaproteobacteria bacterium]MBW6476294.1 chemotaxis response regulator protein-glutamate methylesterase [Chromatiales bacterium]
MPIRVLVVDDSGFFRRRLKEMLNSDAGLEVVGEAVNGVEAVEMAAKLRPDVITMDIEMPVMDGITATKRIMQSNPVPILMFSSLTTDGAQTTLDALDAGAVDYLPKRFEDISKNREEATRTLCERIHIIFGRGRAPRRPLGTTGTATAHVGTARRPLTGTGLAGRAAPTGDSPAVPLRSRAGAVPSRASLRLVAIGTSTGGPVALQEVLTKLPANFPFPLVLVQHMPGSFTPAFAQRLNQLCQITVKEAEDGDVLKPAIALLAPGGKQMVVESRAGRQIVRILDAQAGQTYKPSADITLSSVAKVFPGQTLAVILTGMGADGREGCRSLKAGGSTIWSQDEASCVVYGMPAAVADAGLSDRVLSLKDVGPALAQI